MQSVLVVGGNTAVQRMFRDRGWKILQEGTERPPDLVCFTGGEDICPSHYGEQTLSRTRPNPKRDAKEVLYFERYNTVPKIGICRGGQLLNVLSGGAMWQHVNNHVDSHQAVDLLFTRGRLLVTSTHHQMMIPGKEGFVLAVANEATEFVSYRSREKPKYDTEVVWYPKTNSMCFQPHPEYAVAGEKSSKCQDYFFDLIDWAWR